MRRWCFFAAAAHPTLRNWAAIFCHRARLRRAPDARRDSDSDDAGEARRHRSGLLMSRQRVLALLSLDRPSKSELHAAAFACTPEDLRGSLWKLLLDYYPLERAERQAFVAQRRREYFDVYLPATLVSGRRRSFGGAEEEPAGASPSPPPPPPAAAALGSPALELAERPSSGSEAERATRSSEMSALERARRESMRRYGPISAAC